jgi:hypothetical protein
MTMKPHSPIGSRQRYLVELLEALGGPVGNLDFQKLLFLHCQEGGVSAPYEFVPYMYGAFSFTSYADRRKLVERGLLEDDVQYWALTPEGRGEVTSARSVPGKLGAFVREYQALRGDALVAETYRRFPYYATKSMIAKQVLRGDKLALARIEATRPKAATPGVATIGYEGHTLEGYLNLLIEHGVTFLCDVRRNAISRKYGFSKSTLAKACEGVGLRYEHLPELGIASDKRRSLGSQADYDALFDEYERRHLPKQREALGTIRDWVQGGARVALTCYEHSPEQCHRHCVANALEETFGSGFKSQHL